MSEKPAEEIGSDFYVRFWGVRGSIPCPGPDYVRYGGNTSCIEIGCGENLLIFDGGTGLRELGEALAGKGPLDADMFFTHTHIDHINGVPFFKPIYDSASRLTISSGHLDSGQTIRQVLDKLMAAPIFPIPIEFFGSKVEFSDFACGAKLTPRPGIEVRTAHLNHPNQATGYRVEYGGKSICYVTDTEHRPEALDANILGLIEGTDIFIYDATYTDDEYPDYKGWGHSTWQEGMRLANKAEVGTYVIFHHDPGHKDDFMDQVAEEAERARPGTLVAREGMVLTP
ncbi:MAG: MBL fold metallo-hydrolase [Alphaproteobacteria bacterium]